MESSVQGFTNGCQGSFVSKCVCEQLLFTLERSMVLGAKHGHSPVIGHAGYQPRSPSDPNPNTTGVIPPLTPNSHTHHFPYKVRLLGGEMHPMGHFLTLLSRSPRRGTFSLSRVANSLSQEKICSSHPKFRELCLNKSTFLVNSEHLSWPAILKALIP